MNSVMEMDNRGFEKEGRTIPDEEIHPTISPSEDEYLPHDADCPCVESQIECSCDKAKPDTSKVELQAWVKPKGWMLIGLSLALVAWCTIYFTLSALQML